MPKPPILPLINWEAVSNSGKLYTDWLAAAEKAKHVDEMETTRKSLSLEPDEIAFLEGITRPVHVVAIAEDWCGDVIRHVPALQVVADAAPQVQVRYITREQHPGVFGRFLTNGGEAIPKFIFLSERFVECGNWGPMPADCRKLLSRGKACGDIEAARKKVSALYDADPAQRIVIRELIHHLDVASAAAP
jgi:hypothetical protein